jgi:hypothetical protein
MDPAATEIEPFDLVNVTQMFGRQPCRKVPIVDPPTSEEIAEYRRIKPLLLQIIQEWKILKGPDGCPVARQILSD